MIAMPLALATIFARRYRLDWGLFGIGAVTFIVAQLFHIPFNLLLERWGILPSDVSTTGALILLAIILGLSAGVFEEVARYLSYRYWATDARTWSQGLMLGAGHGGIEAILLGFIGLANFLFFVTLNVDRLALLVPAESLPLVQAQINGLASLAWYDSLLGAVERAFAMMAHLALSVMVLQCFLRRQIRWLFLAIGYHALLDALAVYAVGQWNAYVAEFAIGVVALGGLGIIWLFRDRSVPEQSVPAQSTGDLPPKVKPRQIPVTRDKLEESRYQ